MCQTVAERDAQEKNQAVRKRNNTLQAIALQLVAEQKEAEELAAKEREYVREAAQALAEGNAPERQEDVDGTRTPDNQKAASTAETDSQDLTPMKEKAEATLLKGAQILGKRKRGRPSLTAEEKDARERLRGPVIKRYLRPEQRINIMTPDAETRKRIVAEVIQRAEERNNAEVSVSAVRFLG